MIRKRWFRSDNKAAGDTTRQEIEPPADNAGMEMLANAPLPASSPALETDTATDFDASSGQPRPRDAAFDPAPPATAPTLATPPVTAPPPAYRPPSLDRLWIETENMPRTALLPRFAANVSDDVSELGREPNQARRKVALRDALGASQPVTQKSNFAGRHDVLQQLIAAVEQQRLHVVVYGERGIGKTSLAHVFAETAREANYLVLYGSCGSEARFEPMFRSFAARIPQLFHRSILPNSIDAERGAYFDAMLEGPFGPRELADLFAEIVGTRVIIILDEYDQVTNAGFRSEVAELIKNLSDRAARVQLVLTGVAQNLDELIGYAPSIRRNITGVPMQPMTAAEARELLAIGERAADLLFDGDAARMVTMVAGGSPYLLRLLAHQAGLEAIDKHSAIVSLGHGQTAIDRVLTNWNASLPRRVQASLGRDAARAQWPLLIAAARAGRAADGFFSVDDVVAELGDGAVAADVNNALREFTGNHDLLEAFDQDQETRLRFRYPGVSSLLLMSAAMAGLAA